MANRSRLDLLLLLDHSAMISCETSCSTRTMLRATTSLMAQEEPEMGRRGVPGELIHSLCVPVRRGFPMCQQWRDGGRNPDRWYSSPHARRGSRVFFI